MIYFSPREREVLALIQARALSPREIGKELKLSHHTVRFYLKAIRKKLPPSYWTIAPPGQAILFWTLHAGTP